MNVDTTPRIPVLTDDNTKRPRVRVSIFDPNDKLVALFQIRSDVTTVMRGDDGPNVVNEWQFEEWVSFAIFIGYRVAYTVISVDFETVRRTEYLRD